MNRKLIETIENHPPKLGWIGGVPIDSYYEAIFYIVFKVIKKIDVKRNLTTSFYYTDENGISRQFFPDFIVNGCKFVEVKGRFTKKDIYKRRQVKGVIWYDSKKIQKMGKYLNSKIPNWKSLIMMYPDAKNIFNKKKAKKDVLSRSRTDMYVKNGNRCGIRKSYDRNHQMSKKIIRSKLNKVLGNDTVKKTRRNKR